MRDNLLEKQKEEYFQREKIKIIKQLKFAKSNVLFYKEKLKNIKLKNIKSYNDFSKIIPIVDSINFIRSPKLFTSNLPVAFVRFSSNTTGKPKKIFLTKHDLQHWATVGRLSKTPYFKRGMVISHSRRKERFYLSGLDKSVKNSGGKVITFNPKNKFELLNCVRKSDIILDYAEMIYYIAKQLSSISGVNLNKRLIISYTGNKLNQNDIKEIKKNFNSIGVNVSIYSEYATSETGPIGYVKEDGPFKITYSNNVFIEVIDSKNNLPAKEGEIIVTALNRTGSVFIRYRVGDMGKIFFRRRVPFFKLKRRTSGIKVASVFFAPECIFNIIRNFLKQPIFSDIKLREGKTSYIIIKIVSERAITKQIQKKLEEELINKMHFEGDIGSTVNLKITFIHRRFNEKEIRKGFSFSQSKLKG